MSEREGFQYTLDDLDNKMKVGGIGSRSISSHLKPLTLSEKMVFLKKKNLTEEHIAQIMFSTMIYVDPFDENNTKCYIYKKTPYKPGSSIFNLHTFRNVCSPYRLIQFTGTCYLNACINSLFMPVETRHLLEDMYNHIRPELKKSNLYKLSYQEIASKRGSISHKFYSLVYNKIIKNIYIDNDIDLMNELGLLVKRDYCETIKDNKKWDDHCRNITSGTGGITRYAIISILNNIFDDLDEEFKIRLERIFHIRVTSTKKIPETVMTYNGMPMKIISGNLSFSGKYHNDETFGHAVTCYICENKSFIFDSNNYIFEDNWERGSVKNYAKYFKHFMEKKKINEGRSLSIENYYEFVIYISEDYIKSEKIERK
jgi:hypothetical protein